MSKYQWWLSYDRVRNKENPTWDAIESLIRKMDGRTVSNILLYESLKPDDFIIKVLGGDEGFVCVWGELPQSWRFALLNPDVPDDALPIEMHVGGQLSEYDANQVVPKEWAIKAVHHFLRYSISDRGLQVEIISMESS